MSQSLYTVSIYDTLGPSTTEYIINNASLACVATSLPHIPTLLKLKPHLPTLKIIVSLDPLDAGEQPGISKGALLGTLASELGVTIHYIGDVERLGASLQRPCTRLDQTTSSPSITSGTTAHPKGVTLSHVNAVAAASCSRYGTTVSLRYPLLVPPTRAYLCSNDRTRRSLGWWTNRVFSW
jgi:long-chain acyl-CoA synthetase